MAQPFPVQRIGNYWHVLIYGDPMPCSLKQDAEDLAELPVQEALTHGGQPDEERVRRILEIGVEYPKINRMLAFRHLQTWLEREDAIAAPR